MIADIMHLADTIYLMLTRVWRALLDTLTVLSICAFIAIAALWPRQGDAYFIAITRGGPSDYYASVTLYALELSRANSPSWSFTISRPRLVFIASAIPALRFAAWTRKRLQTRRRKARGQCLKCGYDLRASPDRCPECGTVNPVTETAAPTS
jgi:hypothetical protein